MMYKIFYWIFKWHKWSFKNGLPKDMKKCVLVAAPHTSNWDYVYAMASFYQMGVPVKYTIKKEWYKFPFNLFFNKYGGIPIDRKPAPGSAKGKLSTVDAMVNLIKDNKEMIVLVTPEGTRKKRERWKTGFYHVALNAGVPIAMAYIDYSKKECGIDAEIIYPTGNKEADLKKIMDFYRTKTPKFPELFSVDLSY